MDDLNKVIKGYSEMERRYADNLFELSERIINPIIKVILKAVAEDSVKHSRIYETLLKLKDENARMITEEEYDMISKEIEEHIKLEAEMIRNSEKLMEMLGEKVGRFLVASIVRDEKFHHELLIQVRDIIIKRETLLDSEKWEKVWRKTLYRE